MNIQTCLKCIYGEKLTEIFEFVEQNIKNDSISQIDELIHNINPDLISDNMRLAILRSTFRIKHLLKNYDPLLKSTLEYFQENDLDYSKRMRGLIR